MVRKYKYEFKIPNDKIIVIPWGSKGAYAVQLSKYETDNIIFSPSWLPSTNAQVIDTLGAGDTFNGAFLYGFRQKWNLQKCCDFANKVAGYKVCFKGIDCVKNLDYNMNAKL